MPWFAAVSVSVSSMHADEPPGQVGVAAPDAAQPDTPSRGARRAGRRGAARRGRRSSSTSPRGRPHRCAGQRVDGQPAQPDRRARPRPRRPARLRPPRGSRRRSRSRRGPEPGAGRASGRHGHPRKLLNGRSRCAATLPPDATGTERLDRRREPRGRPGPGRCTASPPRRCPRRHRPRRRDPGLGRRRRPRGHRPGRVRPGPWRWSRAGVTARCARWRGSPPTTAACSPSCPPAPATTSPASSTSRAPTSTPPSHSSRTAASTQVDLGRVHTADGAHRRGSRPSPTPGSTRWRTSGPTACRGAAARRST